MTFIASSGLVGSRSTWCSAHSCYQMHKHQSDSVRLQSVEDCDLMDNMKWAEWRVHCGEVYCHNL